MAPSEFQPSLWESVTSLIRSAQEKNVDPLHWALQLRLTLASAGISLPSPDLAQFLVTHIFWENHSPLSWKLLEKAISVNIVPPLLVLALLSPRVIPNRKLHPAAYRLYMELLKRHAFSFMPLIRAPGYHKTMNSIDDILHLSETFGVQDQEPGSILLAFVFSIVWELLDASLDEEGLLELTSNKRSKWPSSPHDMDLDGLENSVKRNENHDALEKANTEMAIELIQEFLQNKVTSRILHLASQNMATHWEDFSQRFRVLATKSMTVRKSKHINPEALTQLAYHTRKFLERESKTIPRGEFHAIVSSGSKLALTSDSALWLPIDLFFEDIMDGTQAAAASAVENLTGLVKALQAANSTSWHDAFLALWLAALRLVQRERDPIEGPVPRTDTFLCVLLSVTPLAVANIIEEEESQWIDQTSSSPSNQWKEKKGKCRQGLINSLQQLGDYESLLTPPRSVQSVANQAAAKAIMFISGITNSNGSYENTSMSESASGCSGNMRHLIVEACISRNLLDTSAYLWPGFVIGGTNQVPQVIPSNISCWSLVMKGSPLTPSLTNSLITTPASSLAEIEKMYEVATTGSEDEKIAVASILCGASLFRGWSIQEHVIIFIVTLLSPPAPADLSGSYSHLINSAPFLNVLLVGISPIDCVHIFSLHGVVPLLAGALMPICEAFGSGVPNITWTLPTGELISSHAVFSTAFTLLLRLWRFDHPPLDYVLGDVPPVGPQPSPEYLLLVRNCRLECFGKSPKDRMARRRFSKVIDISVDPIFMDSFPRLKQWYRQHQECMASILSELKTGSPVHHIVDSLLSMMFKKANKGGSQSLTPSSGSSSLSTSGGDDSSDQLKLPAWDILEAAPFVLDAALTACAHGSLSPRELATGLKILADFLPATLGTMVSYFSSEVTRGLWKPVSMNGTDWPSPAANLASVEQQIEKILAATGVDVPRLPADGISAATLPLPLAALVSLTITYKLDKATERFLVLVGPALDSLAAACPWPCMPIVTSLWTQKVKRWSDFLIFSASRTVFHHNRDAVIQLLRSCFTCTLGLTPTSQLCSYGGVGALLGHGFGSRYSGGISTAAPGILYIKVHRSIRDVMFLTEEILSLLMFSVKSIATRELPAGQAEKLKKTKDGSRYGIGQVSLSLAMRRVKLAASLGASLVWISGGLNLVQALIKETLPSWFISVHGEEDELGGMVPMLRGYALAYFAILSSAFAWGVDSSYPASKRRLSRLQVNRFASNPKKLKMRPILMKGHERPLTFLRYNREGDLLFSCAKDHTPTLWFADNGERLGTYRGHNGAVWCCDVSRDSSRLITGSADQTAKLWDVKSGKELFTFKFNAPTRSVDFAVGDRLAVITTDHFVDRTAAIHVKRIAEDPEEQDAESVLVLHCPDGKKRINRAVWGPLNQTIVSGGEDKVIRIWDAETGKLLKQSDEEVGHKKDITSLCKAADDSHFLTGSLDKTAKLWDMRTLTLLKTYTTVVPVNAVSLSPLLNHVVLGGGQDASAVTTTDHRAGKFEAKFYDKILQEEIGGVKGHFGPINALAFNPDGKSFSSGGEDGYVRLHHFDSDYFNIKI